MCLQLEITHQVWPVSPRQLGNIMYSRRLINGPDTDYLFREDSKEEIKQEKSVTVETPLSSQCFIRY